jgi:hypothetical protein
MSSLQPIQLTFPSPRSARWSERARPSTWFPTPLAELTLTRSAALVRRVRSARSRGIFRPLDDPHYVIIELDFDGASEARRFLERLEQVWKAPELSPATSATARGGANPAQHP